MDNLKSPASGFTALYDGENTDVHQGFTKLELASLMVMQGMLSNSIDSQQGYQPLHSYPPEDMAKNAVSYARAVLEEANK